MFRPFWGQDSLIPDPTCWGFPNRQELVAIIRPDNIHFPYDSEHLHTFLGEWNILLIEKIETTTWDVWTPVNDGILTISTGGGFLPSTVCAYTSEISIFLGYLSSPSCWNAALHLLYISGWMTSRRATSSRIVGSCWRGWNPIWTKLPNLGGNLIARDIYISPRLCEICRINVNI